MSLRIVEIIGGGLSGLSLGLGLRARGIPVRLLEAGRYPRHRVCGEFITALDETTSNALQLEPILRGARPADFVSWFDDGHKAMRHRLPDRALCISRHQLDAAMAQDFVARGGDLRTGHRATNTPQAGRVMASGRRPDPSSPWIGLKQHFRGLALKDDLELHLGKNAYAGLTRVADDTVNACGLFPRPANKKEVSLTSCLRACGMPELAARLERATTVDGSFCAVAGLGYGKAAESSLSLGDHQGLIPPFTGNGMTIALQSAALALDPIERWSCGYTDWSATVAAVRRTWRRRFGHRIAIGNLLHPWLLSPGRRRIVHLMHKCKLLPFDALYRLCH